MFGVTEAVLMGERDISQKQWLSVVRELPQKKTTIFNITTIKDTNITNNVFTKVTTNEECRCYYQH
jgi:hypothetical protein